MLRFILVALCVALASPMVMAKTTTIKIATLAPDGTGWMKLMRQAATEIEKDTEGRVRIRYFPGGVQGSDKSVLRKIQIRQLQGGAVSTGAMATVTNATQLYGLPFTFQNLAEIRAVRAEFDPIIATALADNGFTLLGLSEGGFAYLMSASSLANPEDFPRKKVWVPEGDIISQTTFKNGGVEPISLPVSDVYTSLQTGLIDTIAANPSTVIALQWHSKLSYAADFPLVFIMGMLVVDSRTMDSLEAGDQKIVKTRMAAAFKAMDLQNEKDEQAAREALISNGVSFEVPAAETQAAWRKMAGDSMSSLREKGIYPADIYQKLLDRLQQIRATGNQ